MNSELEKVMDTLNPRERQVLVYRYGLGTGIPRTLKSVGEDFGGVSSERIRQVESKALRKLRHPTRFNIIKQIDRDTLSKQESMLLHYVENSNEKRLLTNLTKVYGGSK
jgi:hypothetical protein